MAERSHIHTSFMQEKSGFSLLELILVLTLLGIIGLVGTMGFVRFSQGFVFARDTNAVTAKGQLAMMRLVKEMQSLSTASIARATRLEFTALRDGVDDPHNAQLLGNSLFFDDQVLIDQVNGLVFSYFHTVDDHSPSDWSADTRLIDINLTLNGPDNAAIVLQTRVALRNM